MGEEIKKIRPKKTIDEIEKSLKENYKKSMAKIKAKRLNELNKKLVAENKQLNENISKLKDYDNLKANYDKLKADYEKLKRFEIYNDDDWWFNMINWLNIDLRNMQEEKGFSRSLCGNKIQSVLSNNIKLIAKKE